MVQLLLNRLKKFEKKSHDYWDAQGAFENAFEEAKRIAETKWSGGHVTDKTILNMLSDYAKSSQLL